MNAYVVDKRLEIGTASFGQSTDRLWLETGIGNGYLAYVRDRAGLTRTWSISRQVLPVREVDTEKH